MTLQQQAYGLIDKLPDDSVQVVIQVMRRMLPYDRQRVKTATKISETISPKMRAYIRMQELRKETAKYDVSDAQRKTLVPRTITEILQHWCHIAFVKNDYRKRNQR